MWAYLHSSQRRSWVRRGSGLGSDALFTSGFHQGVSSVDAERVIDPVSRLTAPHIRLTYEYRTHSESLGSRNGTPMTLDNLFLLSLPHPHGESGVKVNKLRSREPLSLSKGPMYCAPAITGKKTVYWRMYIKLVQQNFIRNSTCRGVQIYHPFSLSTH